MNKLIARPRNLFAILVLMVIVFQPFKVGFEKGHHGWVCWEMDAIREKHSPEGWELKAENLR